MTKWHWSFWEAVAVHRAVGLVLPLVARRGQPARRRDRVRDGDARVRAGGLGARFKNPYQLTGGEDGFGVDYTKLPDGFVGIFNTKNLYWLALGYAAPCSSSAAGRSTRRRATSGRRSARTSCASRCSGCARSTSS